MTQPLPIPEKMTEAQAAEAFEGPARRTSNGTRYPWDEWFDGTPWMLSHTLHFPSVKSLRIVHAMIRKAAGIRGVKVRCRRYEDLGKIAVQKVHDASAHKDMESKGKRIRRSVRHRPSSIERGQQQSRRKTG